MIVTDFEDFDGLMILMILQDVHDFDDAG